MMVVVVMIVIVMVIVMVMMIMIISCNVTFYMKRGFFTVSLACYTLNYLVSDITDFKHMCAAQNAECWLLLMTSYGHSYAVLKILVCSGLQQITQTFIFIAKGLS
jgi:hypothetical protein